MGPEGTEAASEQGQIVYSWNVCHWVQDMMSQARHESSGVKLEVNER